MPDSPSQRQLHPRDYQVIAGKPVTSIENHPQQAIERQNYLQKIHDAFHAALDALHESGVTDISCPPFGPPRFERDLLYNIASGSLFWNGRSCDINLMSYAMPRNPKHKEGRPALQAGQCVMSIVDTVDSDGNTIVWDVYAPWHNKTVPSMDFNRWFVKCRNDEPDLEGMPFLAFMKGYNVTIKPPYYDFKPYNRPNPFASMSWMPSRQRQRLARLARVLISAVKGDKAGNVVDITPSSTPPAPPSAQRQPTKVP